MSRTSLIAYTLCATAIAIAAATGYAANYLFVEAQSRALQAANAVADADRVAKNQQLHSLLQDTAEERGDLDALIDTDVVGLVETIERAAQAVGVKADVSDALPQGPGEALPGGKTLQTIAFVVNAKDSFTNVMRALAAFENLSVPSVIEQFDLDRGESVGGTQQWQLSVRLRIYTTAAISS